MSVSKTRTYTLKVKNPPLAYVLQSRPRSRSPLLHFDTDKKENRSLRYAVNQKSPFQDEQDGNVILVPIIFEDGMLHVPETNPVLQEFLHYHPKNGVEFIELDTNRDAQLQLDKMDSEDEAIARSRELEIEEYAQIARAGLSLDTTKMSSAEIKRDVRLFARNNPTEFLKLLDDPSFKMHDFVGRCIEGKLISFRNKGRDIYFNLPHNKSKVITIPFGENRAPALSTYLQSDAGLTSYELLKTHLEG